ncbi:MAG: hypothetical protein R3D67_11085 [Hyphomicrobiaceae bacterium]
MILALLLVLWAQLHAAPSSAQVSQPTNARSFTANTSSFPRSPAVPRWPLAAHRQSQPLYLQGDELIYDTKGNRVIARGNVEIYYNNYILTADEVVYDQECQYLDRDRQCPAQGTQRQHPQERQH